MQITQIKKIGKGERYSIFIDGIFDCALETEILVKAKLKEGQEIEEDEWREIKLKNSNLACFDRGLSYLEKSLKTKKQLKEYLKSKGYLEESIDKAINKLEDYGYIDDSVFAESFIQTYKNKKGNKKLRFELLSKGVAREIIDEKLEQLVSEEEATEICKNILKKYLKNKVFDAKTKNKAYAHLINKGFGSEIALKVLSEVKDESWD